MLHIQFVSAEQESQKQTFYYFNVYRCKSVIDIKTMEKKPRLTECWTNAECPMAAQCSNDSCSVDFENGVYELEHYCSLELVQHPYNQNTILR